MKPQIYTFETLFNFGEHKGKSLKEVINTKSKYIGWLIFHNVLLFIIDPQTLTSLEKEGFFDDLEFSYPGSGGYLTFSEVGIKKNEIIEIMRKRHEDYIADPEGYTKLAIQSSQEYFNKGKY